MVKKFATAINCMDGRVQKPVIDYMLHNFNVDYIDMITEPGPNKILSEGKDAYIIEHLKEELEVSVKKHGSEILAIVAHYDCAGNPEDEEVQKKDLLKAVDAVRLWGFPIKKIIALWLDQNFKPSIVL